MGSILKLLASALPDWSFTSRKSGPATVHVCHPPGLTELPSQGWKIHLSTTPRYYRRLLNSVLPIMCKYGFAFKVLAGIADVEVLNSGMLGEGQVGKVVTIYVADLHRIAQIASELNATIDTPGPLVPNEPQLVGGRPIFFRYGAFASTHVVADGEGRLQTALSAPDGSLVPDVRGALPPAWAPALPLPTVQVDRGAIVSVLENLLELVVLARLPRAGGHVLYAMDRSEARQGILKIGLRGDRALPDGSDRVSRIRKETRLLQKLRKLGYGSAPEVLAAASFGDAAALFMNEVAGSDLLDIAKSERHAACLSLLDCIEGLHVHGYRHNDIKPSNALYFGGRTKLVDFELATPLNIRCRSGTRIYTDKRGLDSIGPGRDWYACAMTILSCSAGMDLARLPGEKQVRSVCRELWGDVVFGVVCGILERDVEDLRRPDAQSLISAIAASPLAFSPSLQSSPPSSLNYIAATEPYETANGLWRNEHLFSSYVSEGINIGAAGILIAMLSFPRGENHARRGLSALQAAKRGPHGGLFTGDAGVAIALAAWGKRLVNDNLIDAAVERLKAAVGNVTSLDFFNGGAGVLFAGAVIGELTGRSQAKHAVEPLFQRMQDASTEDNVSYLGVAHGQVGLAMSAAYYASSVDDPHGVARAAQHLSDLVSMVEPDGRMLRQRQGGPYEKMNRWCHGGMGLLWALLALRPRVVGVDSWIDTLLGHFLSEDVLADPTLCHGMAGQLEVCRLARTLPSPYAAAADQRARHLVKLLRASEMELGTSRWHSESSLITTPDLWVGFGGPALQLRLYETPTADKAILTSEYFMGMSA